MQNMKHLINILDIYFCTSVGIYLRVTDLWFYVYLWVFKHLVKHERSNMNRDLYLSAGIFLTESIISF